MCVDVAADSSDPDRAAARTGLERSIDEGHFDSATRSLHPGVPVHLSHADPAAGGVRIQAAGKSRDLNRTARRLEFRIALEAIGLNAAATRFHLETGLGGHADFIMEREMLGPTGPMLFASGHVGRRRAFLEGEIK